MSEVNLQGKIALVTGASRERGIGTAVARRFAEAGAAVFITYYRPYDAQMPWGSQPQEAEALLQILQQQGTRCAGLELDLSAPEAAVQLFDQAERILGPVDILVNNAVIDFHSDLQTLDAAQLDQHYALNLRAVALLCAEFFRRHDSRPEGRIINLTSGQGLGPMPDNLAYAATKGAVEALTISLTPGMAEKGITINAVDPGPTDTGWMDADTLAQLSAKSPFGRVGTPEDAARLICFLASPDAQWITGQVLRTRGGF